MAHSSATSLAAAMKRLHRDLFEVEMEPVPGCTVCPLEENLLEWQGTFHNIVGLKNAPISSEDDCLHFCMRFPATYPLSPPEIFVSAGLPHPNIERCSPKPGGWEWQVCLSMLEPRCSSSSETEPFMKWSSAYSARSLLVQMASFVQGMGNGRRKLFMTQSRGNVQTALQRASNITHRPASTASESVVPRRSKEFTIQIDGSNFRKWQNDIFQKLQSPKEKGLPPSSSKAQNCQQPAIAASPGLVETTPKPSLKPDMPKPTPKRAEKWQLVRRGARVPEMLATAGVKQEAGNSAAFSFSQNNIFSVLNDENKRPRNGPPKPEEMSKAALKNLRRRERRKQLQLQQEATAQIPTTCGQLPAPPTVGVAKQPVVTTPPTKKGPVATHSTVRAATNSEKSMPEANVPLVKMGWTSPASRSSSSLGQRLSSQVLSLCLEYAGVSAVLSLGLTAKYLNVACENGRFWMRAFRRTYPQFNTTASGMESWKYAYFMCRHNIPSELQCWVTKRSVFDGHEDAQGTEELEDDFGLEDAEDRPLFGIPIVFTRNPKTQCVDYMASTFECLSREGFGGGVRHTVMNTPFSDWMPLFLDDDHFERSLKFFKRLCLKISGDSRGYAGASFHRSWRWIYWLSSSRRKLFCWRTMGHLLSKKP